MPLLEKEKMVQALYNGLGEKSCGKHTKPLTLVCWKSLESPQTDQGQLTEEQIKQVEEVILKGDGEDVKSMAELLTSKFLSQTFGVLQKLITHSTNI